MSRLLDALIIIVLICLMSFAWSTIARPETQTNSVEPLIVPIPTLCGPAVEFMKVMKEGRYKLVVTKQSEDRLFTIFANKQNSIVVAMTVGPITCILADEDSADIELNAMLEEM